MSDLSFNQGDTYVVEVPAFTDQSGTLINDATAVYRLTAKYAQTDLDSAAIINVTATQTSPGVAFLTIPPSATQSLQCPRVLYFTAEVKETSGRTTTIDSGKLTILASTYTGPQVDALAVAGVLLLLVVMFVGIGVLMFHGWER